MHETAQSENLNNRGNKTNSLDLKFNKNGGNSPAGRSKLLNDREVASELGPNMNCNSSIFESNYEDDVYKFKNYANYQKEIFRNRIIERQQYRSFQELAQRS